ncbi:DUF6415 family natural product biosynthesis protein [Streptomyces sp. NPDC052000]|uniref:DUF6415 family natural product biosynthesis protein n=1 Tax=Streptomyces sp. NPDC052000 TaxID=3155676 RepID=UPI00344B1684
MNTSSDPVPGPGEFWGVAEDCRSLLRRGAPEVQHLDQAEEIFGRMRRHLTRLSTAAETAAARLADDDALRSQLVLGAAEARSLLALGSSPALPRTIARAQELARLGLLLVRCLADLSNRPAAPATRPGGETGSGAGVL